MRGRLPATQSGRSGTFFGLSVPPFGPWSDPRKLAELAVEAETSGWDGFFIWDHVMFDPTSTRSPTPG